MRSQRWWFGGRALPAATGAIIASTPELEFRARQNPCFFLPPAPDLRSGLMGRRNEIRRAGKVVVVLQSNLLILERARIATTAAATRLPTVYGYREHVETGGLISLWS
jgi:hypothetical protein